MFSRQIAGESYMISPEKGRPREKKIFELTAWGHNVE